VWQEFKEFLARGSVIELAVGIIIGGAFNRIVQSLVTDIIMPPIGLLLGRVDFAELYINLSDQPYASLSQAQAAGAPTINYGIFINNVIQFLILALVIFLALRQINKLYRQAPQPPSTKACPNCFTTIPIQALRCPNCTSELDAHAPQVQQGLATVG
jgi:large conductance mechanosensitive channel